MAKRRKEVLEYILMNLLLLSWKAREEKLAVLDSMLEAAAMEVEYEIRHHREHRRVR